MAKQKATTVQSIASPKRQTKAANPGGSQFAGLTPNNHNAPTPGASKGKQFANHTERVVPESEYLYPEQIAAQAALKKFLGKKQRFALGRNTMAGKPVPQEEVKLSEKELMALPVVTKASDLVSVRLSGVGKTQSGDSVRVKWFEFLTKGIDDYSDIEFTPEEAKKAVRGLQGLRTGSVAAIPLTCKAEQCPFAAKCIFQQMGKAPLLRDCLIETNMLLEWRLWYLEEYEVNPESFTEITIINELAEIEILNWRLNNNLSKAENAELIQDNAVGVDPEGNPIIQRQISVFIEAKDKLMNRKAKLTKLMVGDRQERYKREAALKIRDTRDPSESMALIRGKLEQLQRDVTSRELEIQKKSGVIINAESTAVSPEDILGAD